MHENICLVCVYFLHSSSQYQQKALICKCILHFALWTARQTKLNHILIKLQ